MKSLKEMFAESCELVSSLGLSKEDNEAVNKIVLNAFYDGYDLGVYFGYHSSLNLDDHGELIEEITE